LEEREREREDSLAVMEKKYGFQFSAHKVRCRNRVGGGV